MNIPFELNKTHCIDNAQGLRQLPDECIDLTVTSPPYDDMDLDFNPLSKNGLRTYNGYSWDFKTLASELYRVTKPGGVCVWVVNDPTIDGSESLASSLQKIYFRRVGWNIHDTMIYEKAGTLPTDARYTQEFEYIIVLSKNKAPKVFNPIMDRVNKWGGHSTFGKSSFRDKDGSLKTSGKREVNKIGKRSNIWRYANGYGFGQSDEIAYQHPATYPEALARDHITSWSNPGDLVLDVFSGSGTTGKMAIEAGRRFLGFEISQEYTTLANRRVSGARTPLFDWTSV